MKKINIVLFILAVFFVASCGKKEVIKPNAKFIGSYHVSDTWGSSKPELGSGSLDYILTIKPDGDSAVIIDNVNKTLKGVTAKIQGDSILIDKQTAKSSTGETYDVDPETGVLTGNTLKMNFAYNDMDRKDLVGYVVLTMEGPKDTTGTKK